MDFDAALPGRKRQSHLTRRAIRSRISAVEIRLILVVQKGYARLLSASKLGFALARKQQPTPRGCCWGVQRGCSSPVLGRVSGVLKAVFQGVAPRPELWRSWHSRAIVQFRRLSNCVTRGYNAPIAGIRCICGSRDCVVITE